MTKLYVGNLPFNANEDSVRALFATHGAVNSVKLITDRGSGLPRGFGFVDMANEDAGKALRALDGSDFGGRPVKVREAEERGRGGFSGFRRGR